MISDEERTRILESIKPIMILARMQLELLVHLGKLPEELLKGKILDFGAGVGTSTQALTYFGGDVQAVEIGDQAELIHDLGILPKDRVLQEDGILLMERNPGKYDLVTAFMYGPILGFGSEELYQRFYQAAQGAIKSQGRILVTSDVGTFSEVRRLMQEDGYTPDFSYNPGFFPALIGKKEEPQVSSGPRPRRDSFGGINKHDIWELLEGRKRGKEEGK
jgi:hypothetical protein